MRKINAAQLSLLLQISKRDAAKKILVATGLEMTEDEFNELYEKDKNPSLEINKLSEKLKIDLPFYVNDIKKNFLKNYSTGSFILDYPAKKIKPSKKTGLMPRSVTIPSTLRSLLSDEVITEIKERWYKKYAHEVKEYDIVFK